MEHVWAEQAEVESNLNSSEEKVCKRGILGILDTDIQYCNTVRA